MIRKDKLLLLGVKVVHVVLSCKTSTETWDHLAELYAGPLSSRTMGFTEQLTFLNRGSQPIANYLVVHDSADELDLLGAPIPNQYPITHTLDGIGNEFKEIFVVVQAWDTVITFVELHDKLVKSEAFSCEKSFMLSGTLVVLLLTMPNPHISIGTKTLSRNLFPTREDNKVHTLSFGDKKTNKNATNHIISKNAPVI